MTIRQRKHHAIRYVMTANRDGFGQQGHKTTRPQKTKLTRRVCNSENVATERTATALHLAYRSTQCQPKAGEREVEADDAPRIAYAVPAERRVRRCTLRTDAVPARLDNRRCTSHTEVRSASREKEGNLTARFALHALSVGFMYSTRTTQVLAVLGT